MEASVVVTSPDIKKQLADVMRDLQKLKMAKSQPSTSPIQPQQLALPAPPQHNYLVPEPSGICGENGHTVDECTRMVEMTYEGGAEVFAAQGIPQQPPYQQNFGTRNPQGTRANQNWQNRRPQQSNTHPYNTRYPPQQPFYPQQQPYYQPPPFYNQPPYQGPVNSRQQQQYLSAPQQPPVLPVPQKSIEDSLAAFMQETRQAREVQEALIKAHDATVK